MLNRSCLIGYTGFIGSNLLRQHPFQDLYSSTNIEDIRGKHYDFLICAGASAAKWHANRFPEQDRGSIDRLLSNLSSVRASTVVLISTVDVYPSTHGIDESFDSRGLPNHPYGAHRLLLEQSLNALFTRSYTIRLPAVFGPGLKKNIIYDLLHDNCLAAINPKSVFQYYDVSCLWADINTIVGHDLRLVNLVTEPVTTRAILDTYFPGKRVGTEPSSAAYYNILTRHAAAFGKKGPYRFDMSEVLAGLGAYISVAREL
jgi:hypothetical protein